MKITDYRFLQKLAGLPFVEAIWLYGSRARGDHRERSDIDLAIICPQATNGDWLKLLDIIDDADTLLKIDCVRFDELAADEPIRENILRDKIILFERN